MYLLLNAFIYLFIYFHGKRGKVVILKFPLSAKSLEGMYQYVALMCCQKQSIFHCSFIWTANGKKKDVYFSLLSCS